MKRSRSEFSGPQPGGRRSREPSTPEPPGQPPIVSVVVTRRELLRLAGIGAAGVAFGPLLEVADLAEASSLGRNLAEVAALQEVEGTAPPSVTVLRPLDLLFLRFQFIGFDLQTIPNQTAQLVRVSSPAYIVVTFPSQHIAEQAYLEVDPNLVPGGDETPDEPGSVDTRIAGNSRLVFRVPNTVSSIPYTLQSILAWTPYQMNVAATALPPPAPLTEGTEESAAAATRGIIIGPPTPIIAQPTATETALEVPYRLFMSPHSGEGWAHAIDPVTHNNRTELWHTRLGIRVVSGNNVTIDEVTEANRTMRAIWSPDYVPSPGPLPSTANVPFRMSLNANDRAQLVHLTSNYTLGYDPQPVQVDRFMLTGLGAWMNTRGFWDTAAINQETPANALDFSITEWRHRAVMARDNYVRVVYLGYMFPFGHEAALIKITERKFQAVPSGTLAGRLAAYLRQRFYIVIRKPEKTYPASGQRFGGRETPFKRVRITTLVTPNLSDPNDPAFDIDGHLQHAFWPRVGSQYFPFNIVAEDWDGQKVEFSMPLAFIDATISDSSTEMTDAVNAYLALATSDVRRHADVHGQKVAYALPSKPGDTAVESNALIWGASAQTSPAVIDLPPTQPRFYPTLAEADVRLQAAEQASGGSLPGTAITYDPTYLQSAFNAAVNRGAVFVRTKNPVGLSFPADKSGGVVTPNMGIGGLSRSHGPVGGDPASFLGGTFDPAQFFSDAKILGGILLKDIIQTILPAAFGSAGNKVPKLTSRTVYPGDDPTQIPQEIVTTLEWTPDVKTDPLHIFVANPDGKTTKLSITATLVTKLQPPGEPTFEIVGELEDFRVNMLGDGPTLFLVLDFKKLTFTAKKGEKPDIDVSIDQVTFAGVLEFVNALKDFLKSSGTGPFLDITPTQVRAGYTLSIPTVGIGVFTLQNISFGAALTIPFSGDPARVRFAFCERESPFLLTVYAIGGGGFFAIAIGLDGVELLEAALEFGASIAFDIGIAAGEAHIMAGIYFKMEKPGTPEENASLTGYVRLGGSLEILGIITISVEFYMGLTWDITNDEVWGQAKVTVEIEILFFSITVELSVERRFAGGGSSGASLGARGARGLGAPTDPKFSDLISKTDWDVYCDAFAPVP